jgi:hypothetical protein
MTYIEKRRYDEKYVLLSRVESWDPSKPVMGKVLPSEEQMLLITN